MNAQAATSIQNNAMPSKRAAIHATASALGANHANASPAVSAADRAQCAACACELPGEQRDQAALAACSRRFTARQDGGIRARDERVERERGHRQRPILVGGRPHARHECPAHACRDLPCVRTVELVQVAVVVGQESARKCGQIDEEGGERRQGQREGERASAPRQAAHGDGAGGHWPPPPIEGHSARSGHRGRGSIPRSANGGRVPSRKGRPGANNARHYHSAWSPFRPSWRARH